MSNVKLLSALGGIHKAFLKFPEVKQQPLEKKSIIVMYLVNLITF